GAEVVKHRHGSFGSNFVDCATPHIDTAGAAALLRCSVKISIRGLNQTCEGIARGSELVKRGQGASGSNFENRAETVAIPSIDRGPVKVTVCALNQSSVREVPVRAIRLGAKAIQRG